MSLVLAELHLGCVCARKLELGSIVHRTALRTVGSWSGSSSSAAPLSAHSAATRSSAIRMSMSPVSDLPPHDDFEVHFLSHTAGHDQEPDPPA